MEKTVRCLTCRRKVRYQLKADHRTRPALHALLHAAQTCGYCGRLAVDDLIFVMAQPECEAHA